MFSTVSSDSLIRNRVSDAFDNEDCYTMDALAKELGLKVFRTRQILKQALTKGIIQNLSKKDGVRLLFPEPMVEQLKQAYNRGAFGKPRQRTMVETNTKHAALLVQVPVFDSEMAKVIVELFGSKEELSKHLTNHLFSIYKPVLGKLQELESEYQAKKRALLHV